MSIYIHQGFQQPYHQQPYYHQQQRQPFTDCTNTYNSYCPQWVCRRNFNSSNNNNNNYQGHKDEAMFQNRMGGSTRGYKCQLEMEEVPSPPSNVKYIIPTKKNILAKADTGVTQNYWTNCDVKALTNIMPLISGPEFKFPDSTIIQATDQGTIYLHPALSEQTNL
eukprot:5558020-Ditylum_brightwellii.AAC.3